MLQTLLLHKYKMVFTQRQNAYSEVELLKGEKMKENCDKINWSSALAENVEIHDEKYFSALKT